MEKLHFIQEIKHSVNSLVRHFILEGLLLVILGVLVVLYPQILILLAAFFFIILGFLSIRAGLKIRRLRQSFDKFFDLLG